MHFLLHVAPTQRTHMSFLLMRITKIGIIDVMVLEIIYKVFILLQSLIMLVVAINTRLPMKEIARNQQDQL
jgi:hypothetical protein